MIVWIFLKTIIEKCLLVIHKYCSNQIKIVQFLIKRECYLLTLALKFCLVILNLPSVYDKIKKPLSIIKNQFIRYKLLE